MEGEALTSVSKGCFVVRGKKRSSANLNSCDFLGTSRVSNKERWQKSETTWKEMKSQISDLHQKLSLDIFSDLLDFIQRSINRKDESGGKRAEIPAAALITGVNMPDHGGLFKQLSCEVKSSITPHVATLCSKNCANLKSLMKCIGQQVILGEDSDQHNISVDDIADSTVKEPAKNTKSGNAIWKRSTPLTMPILEKWYSKVDHSVDFIKSPKKQRREVSNPPIVVIFQDMEAFLPNVLQDIIVMLSGMLPTLPVVLIFGVATSWASVADRQLPHSATVHLGLEKFYSPSASQHLSLIIDEVLLTAERPFKLSGKCLQLLLDVFLCHDFSVTNFLHALKFTILEHFYEESASVFCVSDIEELENLIKDSSKDILKHLRTLPSINSYFSSLTTKRREGFEKSDVNFKKLALEMLVEIHNFHESFFPVLRSLFSLSKSLPRHPLGRHLRELYCLCDHSPIVESEGYKQAWLLLQVSSRDHLIERLTTCLSELKLLPPCDKRDSPSKLHSVVMEAVKNLESFIDDLTHLEDPNEEEVVDDKEEDAIPQEDEQPLGKVKYAYQLKEKLQNRFKEKKIKKMSLFEKIRMNSLEVLDELYKKILKPPKFFPMHEVFYFDSTSTVKRRLIAAPRLAIQTALSNPQCYLQQSCLNSTDGIIPPTAPDVSIAYKLHNECGRIINLYDWLEAFHTIVTSQGQEDDDELQEINEVTQARFIRAASELQFLGFIKPTKKKTDHVQRLTWSHS